MGSINDDHNLIGLSHLMKDEKVNPEINIDELERSIMNGEKDIRVEEVDLVNQYKSELARLSTQFGVELSSDDGHLSDKIIQDRLHSSDPTKSDNSWISQQASKFGTSAYETPSIIGKREVSFKTEPAREPSIRGPTIGLTREQSYKSDPVPSTTYRGDGINTGGLEDYKFQGGSGQYFGGHNGFVDPYAKNMSQEQQKRQHIQHVFNNISHNGKVPMTNYDLMADREYEDKQMLLASIEELRDDLSQINIDISRIKEVDNTSSMAEIREVYNKLVYKNNSNNYSTFADELFLMGAQAAEFCFDGDKEWFGHRPDLTGWSNTVRGKLRRMRFTKTQIVRKIVDDYQIPPWLQIGMEVIPSAFTHSRHRKTAVRDSVVNNATYQSAIHDLNNIMD